MGGELAEMVFIDPPYNVPINGHVSGSGRHSEFAMASGEMDEATFVAFLATVLHTLALCSGKGVILFVCMDWRHLLELLVAARRVGVDLLNLCVWAKTNAGLGSFYRSQHEFVVVLKSGNASHINNIELGRHGRFRSNLWTYPGMNSFGGEPPAPARVTATSRPSPRLAPVTSATLPVKSKSEAGVAI